MVAQQILVLSVKVRILVGQLKPYAPVNLKFAGAFLFEEDYF